MLRQRVIDVITTKLGTNKFTLLTPKQPGFGDYAIHQNQIEDWKLKIEHFVDPLFEKIEEKSGFINFYIKKEELIKELSLINEEKQNYGKTRLARKARRIMFEFGQPNTHKAPHIGHLFSYCYGEACVRLLEFTGDEVFRANYQGDIGLHVAKCLWSYMKHLRGEVAPAAHLGGGTLKEKINFLQQCYQEGSKAYEDDETSRQEIDELNMKIYKKDPSIVPIWQETRQWCIDFYKSFEHRLGIHYDKYYFESDVFQKGIDIVKAHIGTVFTESQGAVIFKGEDYNLHTRVFLNKYGNPTYEAKDLGLVKSKHQDWSFDKAIITTASEQNEYWRVVKKVIELLKPELIGKIEHIGFGMINLASGKMSSRSGNILTAFGLVDTVQEKVHEVVSKNSEYTPEEIADITEKVTMGAIKYAFLKSEAKKNTIFDIEESISIHGNSGPYLQYAYARCMSIIRKSKLTSEVEESEGRKTSEVSQLNNEETDLLKQLTKFPEIVIEASQKYSPHVICTYLYSLTQTFNTFYEACPILKAPEQEKAFRLQLTQATAEIIKSGLNLLGIEVVEKI